MRMDTSEVRMASVLYFVTEIAWIQRFVSQAQTRPEDFERAFFAPAGACEGEEREVYYIGVERRQLKPFVQLPLHRTSKEFITKFRAHFKGHRIDRQEYNSKM